MDGQYVLQLIASVGGTGIVTASVGALLNRRKMSADTVKVIDEAAGNAVKRVEQENSRLRSEVQEARDEVSESRAEHEQLWRKARSLEHENAMLINVCRDWTTYSRRQAREIRRLGGQVGDPPELPPELIGLSTSPIPKVPGPAPAR